MASKPTGTTMILITAIKINIAIPAIRTCFIRLNRFLIARNIILEKQPLGSYFGRSLYAGIYCISDRAETA